MLRKLEITFQDGKLVDVTCQDDVVLLRPDGTPSDKVDRWRGSVAEAEKRLPDGCKATLQTVLTGDITKMEVWAPEAS